MKRQDFFEKYQINENVLRDTGLVWSELIGITSEFEKAKDNMYTPRFSKTKTG